MDQTVATRRRRMSPLGELVLVGAVIVVTWVLSEQLQVFQAFHDWSMHYQRFSIDQVVMPALAGMAGFAVYAWRRHRDTEAEVIRSHTTDRVLAAKSEHFRSLFEYNPTAVFSLDLDGRFAAVNPASQQLSGYTEKDLQELIFADLVADSEKLRAQEVYLSVLSGCPQTFETKIVHRQGHEVELSITGVPIVVEGEVVGLFGIAQDVGERMRIVDELERARLNAEHTSELKSLFVANVSHEIRTPLTSVLAAIEMLQDTALSPEQVTLTDTADRAGRRLLQLVENLLDFSELESNRAKLETTEFLPRALAASVADSLGTTAQDKGLDFSWTVDPAIDEVVSGDVDRISQVLVALLENAVKFTESGWVRLSLELAELRPTAVDVRFVVQDSGIGLAPEQRDRLFDSFSQVDPSISRSYEGAGLGLAICRRLVRLMGGAITVDSTSAVGSTFSFQLPLSRRPSVTIEPALSG
ncbi:MAG: ATP-binding protein, partial [Marmoricola sp.]